MRHGGFTLPTRRRLAGLCLLYVAFMVYSSTIIGPSGINFVYRDPLEAFWVFLATSYVAHGSDQRADWIGNLLMLVPFGFLVVGAVWPRRPAFQPAAVAGAILVCVIVVLAIKYLQLFFPPRTVTLNYILAQSVGSMIGCAAGLLWHARVLPAIGGRDSARLLVLALRLYTAALFLFVLMPLDFALDAADLAAQIKRLPNTVLALPGSDRPPIIRAILIGVATVAFIPVGMLLTFVRQGPYQVGRGLRAVATRGVLVTAGLYALAALVISAYPVLPSILYRTCGILLGAAGIKWLVRHDADALWLRLRRLAPWAVAPYLLVVLLVNHLLSTHWLTFSAAIAQVYPLGLLPLFDYYIVTKAEAAKNIIGHFALYVPVGVLLRLRYDNLENSKVFGVAAMLSFLVEMGRYLRPGLQGDINAVVVAGLAAAFAAWSMPAIWSMLRFLQLQSAMSGRPSTAVPNDRLAAERVSGRDHC